MPRSAFDRLESWKEIAAYLGRTVRTVQRWQQEGLPVHRHKHQRLSSIFALRPEVDAWRRQRTAAGAAPSGCDHYCLLSSHHLKSRTASGLRKSAEFARLAIGEQPQSADAHASLALALSVAGSYVSVPPRDLMPEARIAAERAIQLDPHHVSGLCALGLVELLFDWKWQSAASRLEAAIALQPGNASAHHWLGLQHLVTGDPTGAIDQILQAHQRDPLSPLIGAQHGWILYLLRRYAEAISVLQAALELDPLFFRTHFTLAGCYFEVGAVREAAAALKRAGSLNDYPLLAAAHAECDAMAGHRERAIQKLGRLCSGSQYVSRYWLARAYMRAEQHERATQVLREAITEREWFVILLGHDPTFDPLRRTSFFGDLLQAIGLPL